MSPSRCFRLRRKTDPRHRTRGRHAHGRRHRNRALLALIAEEEPESLAELAELSGRAKSNLSRTLRTLENYRLVSLKRGPKGRIAPRVAYSDIVLDVPIGISSKR